MEGLPCYDFRFFRSFIYILKLNRCETFHGWAGVTLTKAGLVFGDFCEHTTSDAYIEIVSSDIGFYGTPGFLLLLLVYQYTVSHVVR